MGRTDVDQANLALLQLIDLKEAALNRNGNDGIAAVAKYFPPQSESGSSTPMQSYLQRSKCVNMPSREIVPAPMTICEGAAWTPRVS